MRKRFSPSLKYKIFASILPLATLAAVSFWVIYVVRYNKQGANADQYGVTNKDKYEFAFQSGVLSVLVYYLVHSHAAMLMI